MAPGDAQAPRAATNSEDSIAKGLVPRPGTIPGEVLLDMSKGGLRRYLTYGPGEDSDYVRDVQRLWRALLATMRDESVVDRQITPVCNAICVFLQSASSSPIPQIKNFSMTTEIWMVAFDTLLGKFESGKLKPLRQVLNTLIKILAQHEDIIQARRIQDDVLSKMASIILLGEPAAYLKASMVIFEAFMRSGIPTSRLMSAIGRSHGTNFDHYVRRFSRQGMDGGQIQTTRKRSKIDESIYWFSFSVIFAIADSDTQATAGTFFTSFFSSISGYEIDLSQLWVGHVVTILARYPKAIEGFKNHLLPSLFKLNPAHYHGLLQSMTKNHSDASMLQNALTIIILGLESGFLSEEGTYYQP
jgi:hypothetical protein